MTPAQIRELRNGMGLSQAQFGARLGVSANTIARWERGERAPNQYHQLRLNQLRSQPVDDLDIDLMLARATSDEAGQASMDAVEHADRSGLSPLALHLAGNAALEAAYGTTAAEWIMSKQSIERDRLEAVISELIGAGLWPW